MIHTSCPECGAKMAIEGTTLTCFRCGYIDIYGDYEASEYETFGPDDASRYSEFEAEDEYDDDY